MDNFGYWSRGKERLLLLILIALAVFLYAGFSFGLPWRFNSPDEAANAFFSQRVAQGQKLAAPAELNEITVNPIVHPRSTQLVQGKLAPASFLGLPLIVGAIGRVLGQGVLPYVTPLLAALGLGCFFFIVRGLSGQRPAVLATVLLAMTPAFWYYHSRSFFHNALFFDFLLLAVCLLFQAVKTKKAWVYLVAGLALGLTLSLRTSEIFWMTAAGLVWLGLNWRQVKWRYLWLLILGVLISFSPVLVTNYHIYGSVLSVGYRQDLLLAGDLKQAMGLLSQLVLPFGFHPRLAWKNLFDYTYGIFPLWTLLFLASFVTFIRGFLKYPGKFKAFYLILFLLTAAYVVIYYGSWQFHDNPDPNAVTIGTSYIRYWLPLYIFVLPLLARALIFWLKNLPRIKTVVLVYFFAVLSLTSYQTVFWGPEEGVLKVKENINGYQQIASQVFSLVPEKSVIIAGTMDKVFFPARSVIIALNYPQDYVKIKQLLYQGYAVYYFYFSRTPAELAEFNQRYFQSYGLRVESSLIDFEEQSLYPVVATVDS